MVEKIMVDHQKEKQFKYQKMILMMNLKRSTSQKRKIIMKARKSEIKIIQIKKLVVKKMNH